MTSASGQLTGKKIAILATHGFEESELIEPKNALKAENARVEIISPEKGEIRSWSHNDWGLSCLVDHLLEDTLPNSYDALLLPGGVLNSDQIRADAMAVDFIRHFASQNKPIAAICHAPWALIETGYVKGRLLTSWPSLKTDLINAGAIWVDEPVAVDGAWITSRKPADLPAFITKMIEVFRRSSGVSRLGPVA